MWSIGETKRRGWETLKQYYWAGFLVSLICMVLGGGSSGGNGARTGLDKRDELSYGISQMGPAFLLTIFGIFAVVGIVGFVFKIFIANPVTVGRNRFYMESRVKGQSAGIGKVFWVFGCGYYMNVVKIMFLRDLFTFLWTLLLVIPGIYKGYEYAMIPYILSENPEADSRDVFALTKDMMEGNRFQLFCFELSFIGWYLLGVLLCLIGTVFVVPYEDAATAEVYAQLRGGIHGFPFNGFGAPEPEVIYDQDPFDQSHQSGDNGYY